MMVGETTAGFRLLGHRHCTREQRDGTKKSANQNPNAAVGPERPRIKTDRRHIFRIVFQSFSSPFLALDNKMSQHEHGDKKVSICSKELGGARHSVRAVRVPG